MAPTLDDAQMDITESGFLVHLPNHIRTDQLIELKFESSVFRQSTRFDVFLQDSRQDESVRQRVDPGDATDLVESSTNIVSLPVSLELLVNMSLSSKADHPQRRRDQRRTDAGDRAGQCADAAPPAIASVRPRRPAWYTIT